MNHLKTIDLLFVVLVVFAKNYGLMPQFNQLCCKVIHERSNTIGMMKSTSADKSDLHPLLFLISIATLIGIVQSNTLGVIITHVIKRYMLRIHSSTTHY